MVYRGSKNKIAKYLAPQIQSYINEETIYIEPFVGGANMIDKIEAKEKIGYDINQYLIALLKRAQQQKIEYVPFTKEEYLSFRDNKHEWDKYPDWSVGYVGFVFSFFGMFFRSYTDKTQEHQQRVNNINKQSESALFKDITFKSSNFKDITIDKNSHYVIYLDPPYANDPEKYNKMKFNHDELWVKCKEWKATNPNITILLSERVAPDKDWECIWQMDYKYSCGLSKPKQQIEKLFLYKGE